jgi:hypothetical protein
LESQQAGNGNAQGFAANAGGDWSDWENDWSGDWDSHGWADANAAYGGFVDPNAGFVDPNADFVDPNAEVGEFLGGVDANFAGTGKKGKGKKGKKGQDKGKGKKGVKKGGKKGKKGGGKGETENKNESSKNLKILSNIMSMPDGFGASRETQLQRLGCVCR